MHRIRTLCCTWLAVACLIGPALAQTAPSNPAVDWGVSTDGQLVLQAGARLLWQRCVEGMRWNGRTCTGTPLYLDYPQAVEQARRRSQAEGVRWRLPTARELQFISQHNQRAVDAGQTALLPDASLGWTWSATTSVLRQQFNPYAYENIARGPAGGAGGQQLDLENGWVVNTGTAEMRGDISRRTPMMLRLVRAADRPD